MQVLYYFQDINTMIYQWQKYHIVDEMEKHNCFITILSPTYYGSVEQSNEAIVTAIKTNHYDLFMTCLTDKYLFPETIERIKEYGVPTLLFCPDNLTAPFNHKKIAYLFDLVWLTSKETEYLFRKWGSKTIFLPYAANPYFLIPRNDIKEELSIGFIGTPHGSRIDRINFLQKQGISIAIHSKRSSIDSNLIKAPVRDYVRTFNAFMKYPIGRKLACAAIIDKLAKRRLLESEYLRVLEPVPLSDLASVNCKYALILSFTDADSTGVLKHPVKIVNLRNFEIPMSGGIQFTLYSDELASYFEDDKEIIMGKTMEESADKARFYLDEKRQKKRQEMRCAARKRAETEHTWYRRFSDIFTTIGI